jgi:hypothetical protein
MNNFYLYRLTGQRLHVIIPWDKSETTKSGPTFSIFHNITDPPATQRNRLMARAWKFDDLRTLYYDTLDACVRSASELEPGDGRGWLERELDRELEQIREAVLADTTKTYSNADFEAAVEALRQFAQQRPAFVRDEVERHRLDPF